MTPAEQLARIERAMTRLVAAVPSLAPLRDKPAHEQVEYLATSLLLSHELRPSKRVSQEQADRIVSTIHHGSPEEVQQAVANVLGMSPDKVEVNVEREDGG